MKKAPILKVAPEKTSALRGKRITFPRRVLLDLIQESKEHLDADELYRRAKEIEPNLSLSTVYRNLQLFKKLNLIEERHFDKEHHHYEAKKSSEHLHAICLGCGKVVELQCPLTEEIKKEVSKRKGFEITGSEIRLEGYCSRCLGRRSNKGVV